MSTLSFGDSIDLVVGHLKEGYYSLQNTERQKTFLLYSIFLTFFAILFYGGWGIAAVLSVFLFLIFSGSPVIQAIIALLSIAVFAFLLIASGAFTLTFIKVGYDLYKGIKPSILPTFSSLIKTRKPLRLLALYAVPFAFLVLVNGIFFLLLILLGTVEISKDVVGVFAAFSGLFIIAVFLFFIVFMIPYSFYKPIFELYVFFTDMKLSKLFRVSWNFLKKKWKYLLAYFLVYFGINLVVGVVVGFLSAIFIGYLLAPFVNTALALFMLIPLLKLEKELKEEVKSLHSLY